MPDFSVVAFIPVFNEIDILPATLAHLEGQGIIPHVIDNWSTDAVRYYGFLFKDLKYPYERFPAAGPAEFYEWTAILNRISDLAAASSADWCCLYDADEIRRAPMPGVTLLQAIRHVDCCGFTAIDHTCYNFWPVDESWDGTQDPEKHFQYYSQAAPLSHIKAWKNLGRVDLATSGGHIADFPELNVYPEKFILKHYPIRSTEQGRRKLFRDRLPRYKADEKALGWHVQYDELVKSGQFIRDPRTLRQWK